MNKPPDQTANERTAAFIRGKLAEQRKTATDLAAHLGISRQAAARRLSGETVLNLDDCQLIGDWLGIPVNDLVQPGDSLR
jgi:transcriptional regulator with XRE-family HTH domain